VIVLIVDHFLTLRNSAEKGKFRGSARNSATRRKLGHNGQHCPVTAVITKQLQTVVLLTVD